MTRTTAEITTNEAARRLEEHHLLSRGVARRVLAAGLAGPARRRGSALLYRADAVEALLARPMCRRATLDRLRPFIARLGRERAVTPDQSWEERAAVAGAGWYIPDLTRVAMSVWDPLGTRRYPFLATLGGWVVLGAEIVGTRIEMAEAAAFHPARNRSHARSTFDLQPPGDWFAEVEQTWLPIENGPTWTLWSARTSTRTRLDSLRADFPAQERAAQLDRIASSLPLLRLALRDEPESGLSPELGPALSPCRDSDDPSAGRTSP